MTHPHHSYRSLALFLAVVLGTGWAIGFLALPGPWYAALSKPPFNPPGWVFGPVWTALYILIALAGWRTWRRQGAHSTAFRLWLLQMGFNFLWSPVFFLLHQLAGALVVLLALFTCILLFTANRWNADRTSAWLFIPYALWVTFAGVLNASLILLN